MTTTPTLTAEALSEFHGTENYFQGVLNIVYTDGVRFIAQHGGSGNGADWLITAIASYVMTDPSLNQVRYPETAEPFQIWELTVDPVKHSAVLTCKADDGKPFLVKQDIMYTDFELPHVAFYYEQGILCLPQER